MKNVQTQLQNQKGFTLVEIAIVLVIIGLLLGGVLKGQELIENSKIKSVTNDFDGISAAYYGYQDRTGLVPGDNLTTPTGFVAADSAFWFDLKSEGFIKGTTATDRDSDTGPVHSLDGTFSAVGGNATNALFTKNYICASNIENGVARGMDTKLDDGEPDTGVIRVIEGTSDTGTAAASWNATTTTASVVCREL